MARLADLCDLITEQCAPHASGASVYVGLEHIDGGTFRLTRQGKPIDVQSAKHRFRQGDILYGKLRPYLDKAVLAETDGICSTDILVFRPKPDTVPPYLLAIIHSSAFKEFSAATTKGVNHPRTSWMSLSAFEWDVPGRSEQERIATVLSDVQRAIEFEDKLIDTASDLKRATTRQLFSRGLRGDRAKETEIGPIPECWSHQPLGTLVDISYGAQAAVAHALDPAIGTPILTNINITTGGEIDLRTLRYYAIPEKQQDRLSLETGDVLFNWRSGSPAHVGKTALFTLAGRYTYSSFILRFRPKHQIDGGYLAYYLNYIRSQGFFSKKRNVSSINSVYNASLAATIPIWFPPDIRHQQEITSILDIINRSALLHTAKRAAIVALFDRLLNELLSGHINVNNLNTDTTSSAMTAFGMGA